MVRNRHFVIANLTAGDPSVEDELYIADDFSTGLFIKLVKASSIKDIIINRK